MDLFQQTVPVKLAYDEYDPPVDSGKPPIIFLHGLLQNRESFEEAIALLCQKTKRKVYALDLRGHGSSPYTEEYGVHSFAADVKLFIEEKQLKKITFVCNSFSCRAATVIVNYQPSLIEKLIFVDLFPYSKDNKRMEYATKFYNTMTHFFKICHSMEEIEPTVKKFSTFMNIGNIPIDLLTKQIQKCTAPDEDGGIRFKFDKKISDVYMGGKFTLEPLDVYTGPTLFVYGGASNEFLKDRDDPSLETYFPNLTIVGIPGASHLLIAEKTEQFVEIVEKFLSE